MAELIIAYKSKQLLTNIYMMKLALTVLFRGAFDISLIASLASHLSYWADEDVNHFMLSQMLSRARRRDH
jgi:hypothetical protein